MSDRFIQGAQWNGEPCTAETCVVTVPEWNEHLDPRLAWWKDWIGQEVKAVLVRYQGMQYLLWDDHGAATEKVRNGGSPWFGHHDLPLRAYVAPNPGD